MAQYVENQVWPADWHFQKNGEKRGKTEGIAGRVVFYGCEICSEHRRACGEFAVGFGEQSLRAASQGAGSKLKETGKWPTREK
jgi:hypothetical protein